MKSNFDLLPMFLNILKRDLLIAYRHRLELLNPLLFFVLIILLFPLAISSEPQKLMAISPGVIWIAGLFATLLSLENIFHSDFEDGTLEQLVLAPQPLSTLVLAKLLAHWLITGLPLILVSLLLSQLLYLPGRGLVTLFVSLLLGTPVLTIIGAIGAALTLGLRNRGLLLILLILPLYLPVLIFGTSAVADAAAGWQAIGQLAFLAAFLTLALTFAPFAIAAALRLSVS
jgi:heme exporter protein B